MKELEDTQSTIIREDKKLACLLETIKKTKEDLSIKIRNTKTLHQSIKLILDSPKVDQHKIDEVKHILHRAVNVIQQTFSLMALLTNNFIMHIVIFNP